ncbi:alpha/beta hydrolase family esterase [Streptomyces sp. NPDC091271]|uniref:alpha/beta hydrolase family esterase n=1 Tax=Streptomyces sp. NPDC091271 TaxID=3365980 RepID=UPI0037FA63A2
MKSSGAAGAESRFTVRRIQALLVVVLAVVAAAMLTAVPARAETGFHEVPAFGSNPGNLKMFAYVPEKARSGAPVVVLFHGCGGSAQNLDVDTGWRKYADAYGFTLVLPEQKDENFRTGSFAPCPGRYDLVSPEGWGDRIRGAHPGYAGERPRVQIWHGGSDLLINKKSLEKQRDGWTAVFGVPQTPSSTSRPALGVTKQVYGSGQVETYLIDAMGHEAPVDPGTGIDNCGTAGQGHDSLCGPYYAAEFFGLGS